MLYFALKHFPKDPLFKVRHETYVILFIYLFIYIYIDIDRYTLFINT